MGIIEIRLQLDAWDCFLYSGILYVLNTSNELLAYDWPELLKRIDRPDVHVGLQCAFARADYVKTDEWAPALGKDELYDRLATSIKIASKKPFEIDDAMLDKCLLFRVDNPLGSITSALTIYNNTLFLSSYRGTFGLPLSRNSSPPRKSRLDQIWEGRAVSLSGGGISSLAVGAGSDGAHKYRTEGRYGGYSDSNKMRQISTRHTTAVEWSQISIFRSSLKDPGELIAFARTKQSAGSDSAPDRRLRSVPIVGGLFDYTWAFNDRVFGLKDGRLSTFRYDVKELKSRSYAEDGSYLHHERTITLQGWKGRVISAGTSVFGTVIECEHVVLIAYPDGSVWNIPYRDIARWRTYERSTYYWNQLHLIREHDFVAFAFTDKFFVDAGIKPPTAVKRIE